MKKQNCCACTFELDSDNPRCSICGSKQTHSWAYTQDVDGDTTFETPYTTIILDRARRMILQAAEGAMQRKLTLCLSRPPGHHACSDKKRKGFCHVNFVIDALDFFHGKGLRAVIVDIDAHHGDGTEHDILERDYGFYASIHGFGPNVYPGTGATSSDRILNLPLSKDSKDSEWFAAWNQKLIPFVKSVEPDILLLSCGLDAHEQDILAPLKLTTSSYNQIGRDLKSLNLPVFAILEGGYCLPVLGESMKGLVAAFL
jgi:acetoin utilization deacetylase AcuC-like enzyme